MVYLDDHDERDNLEALLQYLLQNISLQIPIETRTKEQENQNILNPDTHFNNSYFVHWGDHFQFH